MVKKLEIMVCEECGSDDVVADAHAAWSIKEQRYELVETYDKGSFCNTCDGECRIVARGLSDREIEELPLDVIQPEVQDYYIKRAEELYGSDDIEIDETPAVSLGDDDGAFVRAWVWVHNEKEAS